jgi:hypothetical protein
MAMTDFTIDETFVGQTIGPADGFLVNLVLTTPPPRYEIPEGDAGRGIWKRGYLQLRGSGDIRDLICYPRSCRRSPARPRRGPVLPGPRYARISRAKRGDERASAARQAARRQPYGD